MLNVMSTRYDPSKVHVSRFNIMAPVYESNLKTEEELLFCSGSLYKQFSDYYRRFTGLSAEDRYLLKQEYNQLGIVDLEKGVLPAAVFNKSKLLCRWFGTNLKSDSIGLYRIKNGEFGSDNVLFATRPLMENISVLDIKDGDVVKVHALKYKSSSRDYRI